MCIRKRAAADVQPLEIVGLAGGRVLREIAVTNGPSSRRTVRIPV